MNQFHHHQQFLLLSVIVGICFIKNFSFSVRIVFLIISIVRFDIDFRYVVFFHFEFHQFLFCKPQTAQFYGQISIASHPYPLLETVANRFVIYRQKTYVLPSVTFNQFYTLRIFLETTCIVSGWVNGRVYDIIVVT